METITKLLKQLSNDYGYNDVDSLLALKDILVQVWKQKSNVIEENQQYVNEMPASILT